MNGSRYLKLLHDKLKFHMQVSLCSIVMHNNALCDRINACRDFMMVQQIQEFHWPGKSSYLNLTENPWGILKNKVVENQTKCYEQSCSDQKECLVYR